VWTDGDWDYDGDVDGVDAGLWATNFTGELGGVGLGPIVINSEISPEAAAVLASLGMTLAVPEPTTTAGLALIAAALLARRRRSGLAWRNTRFSPIPSRCQSCRADDRLPAS
jgi:hypothetical protein